MVQSGCCAPECVTNTRAYQGPRPRVFYCPVGSREAWLKAIPVTWEGAKGPPKELKICERHFQTDCIVRAQTCNDGQGNVVTFTTTAKLKKGATPSIWPELPASYQGRTPAFRESRDDKEAKRQCRRVTDEEKKVQVRNEADRLASFSSLVEGLQDRFLSWKASRAGRPMSQLWRSDWNESRAIFYQLDYSTEQPRVGRSIDFNNSLWPKVYVFEEEQRTQGRVDRWTSLFALLEGLENEEGTSEGERRNVQYHIGC